MSFWEQHAKTEAARRLQPDGACNAPQECACGHVGQDVFFGSCWACAHGLAPLTIPETFGPED